MSDFSPLLRLYEILEKLYLENETSDLEFAEIVRDTAERIWYKLSTSEQEYLRTRDIGKRM